MRTLTFEINRQDCVGDSVGKHNYNFLSLDTAICNLSSNIYNNTDNILFWFNDIMANSATYNIMANYFSNNSISAYQINHTTINVLSSFWNTTEFTIQYEHNLYYADSYWTGSQYNTTEATNKVIDAFTQTTNLSALIHNANTYLTTTYPASNFNLNTRANVVMTIHTTIDPTVLYNTVSIPYSNNGSSTQTYNANNGNTPGSCGAVQAFLQQMDDYSSNNIGYYQANVNTVTTPAPVPAGYNWYPGKTFEVEFTKQNVNLTNMATIRFICYYSNNIKSNYWVPFDVLYEDPNISESTISDAILRYEINY
jgi:hypothetical protein